MKARTLCLLSALAVCHAGRAADDVRDFTTLTSTAEKNLVLDFRSFPGDISDPGKPRWGYGPDIGKIDNRSQEQHFLYPDHPRPQPHPPAPNWRRYEKVPNLESNTLSRHAVPKFERPEDEKWLNRTKPPGVTEDYRFTSLPDVKAPDTIRVSYFRTPEGIFPKVDPFERPPGTNMLPTIYDEVTDGDGTTVPNSLPSTVDRMYNLHHGDPLVTPINPRSPSNDLREILDTVYTLLTGTSPKSLWQRLDRERYEDTLRRVDLRSREVRENLPRLRYYLEMADDIILGNPVNDRAYSGFPLLHHSGHNRVKRVVPTLDTEGNVTGGNVEVHQVWSDVRIESDAMFYDLTGEFDKVKGKLPAIPAKTPWTITYTIDVLDRGRDDFATTTMFFDSRHATDKFNENQQASLPESERKTDAEQNQYRVSSVEINQKGFAAADATAAPPRKPKNSLVSMDQTFFPMASGTRTVLTIKMPPPEWYNLTYSWGWRFHPPRAQATENAAKGRFDDNTKSIVTYEKEVFAKDPDQDPISALGDLAPEKRMMRAFRAALEAIESPATADAESCLTQLLDARNAYLDWTDRNHLPSGLDPDPDSDLTVLFVNNTTYGELRDGGWTDLAKWRTRTTPVRVTLINADYFAHQYLNVEWGGNRGWEPQFKPTLKLAGSGPFFSFGRFHYQFNTVPGKVEVEAATPFKGGVKVTDGSLPDTVVPGVHRIWMDMHHEPSRRLRFYQFDPTHHDVAIYSLH